MAGYCAAGPALGSRRVVVLPVPPTPARLARRADRHRFRSRARARGARRDRLSGHPLRRTARRRLALARAAIGGGMERAARCVSVRERLPAGRRPDPRHAARADRRRLPLPQRVDPDRARRWTAAGDGVDPRGQQRERLSLGSGLRRSRVGAKRRSGGLAELPSRGAGLPRPSGADRGIRLRRVGQLRDDGYPRGAALGPGQRRRVRRRSGQRHGVRPVGRRVGHEPPAGLAAGARAVPAGDRDERRPVRPDRPRARRGGPGRSRGPGAAVRRLPRRGDAGRAA